MGLSLQSPIYRLTNVCANFSSSDVLTYDLARVSSICGSRSTRRQARASAAGATSGTECCSRILVFLVNFGRCRVTLKKRERSDYMSAVILARHAGGLKLGV